MKVISQVGKLKKDIKDSIFWSISLHYDFYVNKY